MKPPSYRTARSSRGFTLLEILIAIAILGLLVGLAVANFGSIFGGGQKDIAELFVKGSLNTPLASYQQRHGSYPTTLEALKTDPGGLRRSWNGPFVLDDIEWPPIDPWGEPYQYKAPGAKRPNSYDLWSKGPDKESGTADDIGNWPTAEAKAEVSN